MCIQSVFFPLKLEYTHLTPGGESAPGPPSAKPRWRPWVIQHGSSFKKRHLLVSIGAYACGLIIDSTVYIWTIVEGAIPPFHWPSPPLVHEMPMEARKGSVLVAFVLKEGLALLHPELLQIPGLNNDRDHFTSTLQPSHF